MVSPAPNRNNKTAPMQKVTSSRVITGLVILLALLAVAYIVQVSRVVSLGYTINELQENNQQHSASTSLLQAESLKQDKLQKFKQPMDKHQLTDATNIRYIKAGRSASLSRR